MPHLSPPPRRRAATTTPTKEGKGASNTTTQRDNAASASSMERALRTLTLQDKQQCSKPGKKHNDQKQNRYSLVKLAQSCNGDRRKSLIAEARCLSVEQIIKGQDEDNTLTEIDLLESKLAHAKSLIDCLERQIDDLSLQKNDAIDWIEELLAKSDQKDTKIRCLNDEKNVAVKRCKELEDELLKTKELREAKFRLGEDSVNAQIISMEAKINLLEQENSDLKSHLLEQHNLNDEYDEEKLALIAQIETYAEDLTIANASLKSKSDELDDALFNLEMERKKLFSSSSQSHDEIDGVINTLLAKEYERNQSTGTETIKHCREKEQQQHKNCDMARVDELIEKNNILSIEQSRLSNENDMLAERVRYLSDELVDQRQQLMKAREDNGLNDEITLLRRKMRDLSDDFTIIQQQLRDANEREENSESEKSKLKSQLNAANTTVKEHSDKIEAMEHELCRHEHANAQLNLTMKKIQEQVDELTLENADLREKNETLTWKQECLGNENFELRRLHSITLAERDDAYATRDNLMELNANLTSDLKMISVEKGRLLHEKKKVQIQLDKNEADCETLQSKMDTLLKEKVNLEDKIVFLEASKASIEKNADRILERDNTLIRQHEQLDVEYKKQSRMNEDLQSKIDNIMKRIDSMRLDNEKLTRDNRTLRELYQRSARF